MRAAVLVVAFSAACGFHAGNGSDASGPGSDSAAHDGHAIDAPAIDAPAHDTAPPADAGPNCLGHWRANDLTLLGVAALHGTNTTGSERDPFLTDDEDTIYFSRGAGTASDTYTAHRNGGGNFMNVAKVQNLSSPTDDGKVTMTRDGTFAAFASEQTGQLAIWGATRDPATGAVDPPSMTPFAALDLSPDLFDPSLSETGEHLYLAPLVGGQQVLAMSTRVAGVYGAYSTTHLDPLVVGGTAADPHIANGELLILFTSRRSGDADLYYAYRDHTTDDFSAPIQLPFSTINTIADEGDAHLSSDGCRLYFSRDTGSGDYDLYEATFDL